MAIYFEDKILQPKADGTQLEKMYFEGMKEIEELYKKHGGNITLRRDVKMEMDVTGTSFKPVPPAALPTQWYLYLEELGSVSIRYSKETPIRQEKGYLYPTQRVWVYEAINLDKTQKDLAWALIKISGMVFDGEDKDQKGRFLKVEDLQKQGEERAEDLLKFAKLDGTLLDTSSEIHNRATLTEIADKLGITVTGGTALAVALEIRDAVANGEKNNNQLINIRKFNEITEKVKAKKTDIPEGPYTKEMLDELKAPVLNAISKKFGTRMPPQCKRAEQIDDILAAQMIEA